MSDLLRTRVIREGFQEEVRLKAQNWTWKNLPGGHGGAGAWWSLMEWSISGQGGLYQLWEAAFGGHPPSPEAIGGAG